MSAQFLEPLVFGEAQPASSVFVTKICVVVFCSIVVRLVSLSIYLFCLPLSCVMLSYLDSRPQKSRELEGKPEAGCSTYVRVGAGGRSCTRLEPLVSISTKQGHQREISSIHSYCSYPTVIISLYFHTLRLLLQHLTVIHP